MKIWTNKAVIDNWIYNYYCMYVFVSVCEEKEERINQSQSLAAQEAIIMIKDNTTTKKKVLLYDDVVEYSLS